MEWISSRAVFIGVSLFVTLAIVTGIVLSFSKVGEVYDKVSLTNISLKDQYDNIYLKYSEQTYYGVDLLNALKKYEEEDNIEIRYSLKEEIINTKGSLRESEKMEELMREGNKINFKTKFTTSVTEENGKTIISFN